MVGTTISHFKLLEKVARREGVELNGSLCASLAWVYWYSTCPVPERSRLHSHQRKRIARKPRTLRDRRANSLVSWRRKASSDRLSGRRRGEA